MFDRNLFLSHFGARQQQNNQGQGHNYDKVVVDSQGVKWGFNQRKGIYENLNTGQKMNSILFENTNISNAAAAGMGDSSNGGWGVSNRSSDVNTPEIQSLLTKKGSSRGKDFRRSDAVVSAQTAQLTIQSETFLPLDAVFYGRIQGPYFDDMWQSNPSTPGPQWRTTGGRNKVYFNPFALLGGASGGTYNSLDNPNPQHIEVQSFKTWTPSNALGQKVGIEVVFGSTTDAKTAYDVIVGTTFGEGIYYHPTTSYGYGGLAEGDRGGRLTFFSRIATSGKTLAMLGDVNNDEGLKVGFPFRRRTALPSQGTYSNAEREQMLKEGSDGGIAWSDYSDWLSSGLTAGVTAELYSRTLWIPLGSSSNTYNLFSGTHYPLGNAFSTVVNNGATGYNLIQNLNPASIPSGNNFHNFMYNNPNGVGSTTPYVIEFAFFRGGGGSTAGLINDWTSFYGVTGNPAYQ